MEPIEIEYEKLEAIPEYVRPLYEEINGKFILTKVNGLKTQNDVNSVLGILQKERDEHKTTKEALKPWSNLNPVETLAQLDRIKELEAAAGGKLDDTKINEMVEGRLAQKTGPIQRQLTEVTEKFTSLAQENQALKNSIESRDRNDSIRSVAIEAKAHSTALPDIEMAASYMLEKLDDGKWVTKSGIDGITPGLDIKTWMREMVKLRPHWWPQSEGGGSRGGSGGFSGNNPFTKQHWNMTEQGRIVTEQGQGVAEQMAKAAGTTFGGPIPLK